MRCVLIVMVALCAAGAQAIPQYASSRKIPCKTPENSASCYRTRGRLSLANGFPSFRLWKIGTKRVFGVYSGPSVFPPRAGLDSESEFPANVSAVFKPTENVLFATFEICPLAPRRPGRMQPVCIESAKNVFVQPQKN